MTRPLPIARIASHISSSRSRWTPGPSALRSPRPRRRYSYAQLEVLGEPQWRQRLRDSGVGPGSFVAVAIPRQVELVVAILGVMKAGAGYVPIEPSLPASRREYILENSRGSLPLAHARSSKPEHFAQPGVAIVSVPCERVSTEEAEREDAPRVRSRPHGCIGVRDLHVGDDRDAEGCPHPPPGAAQPDPLDVTGLRRP